jgi:hypothetical protein
MCSNLGAWALQQTAGSFGFGIACLVSMSMLLLNVLLVARACWLLLAGLNQAVPF